MNDERRYGQNAHLWRRTYGYARRKPNVSIFFDENLNLSRSVDLNTNFRHRDFFEVDGFNISGPNPSWFQPIIDLNYEEGFIFFDNEFEKTASFSAIFTGPPYVVYTAVPNTLDNYNINVFGTALPTTATMYIGASAPFTGYIHYIAMSSSSWPKPYISQSVGFQTTDVWAGEIDLSSDTSYTASYTLLGGGYSYEYYDTIHENFNSFTANTDTKNETVDNITSTNVLSAETTNKIHFIVFRKVVA